jgi:hypothetical protein
MEMFTQNFPQALSRPNTNRGVIVCIPKTVSPKHPNEYTSITLLKDNYKTLARLMAGRMREVRGEMYPANMAGR